VFDGAQMAIFNVVFVSCISSEPRAAFALRPHYVYGHVYICMVDIHSATAEIRRGKKEERKKEETTGQSIMFASATQGGHKNLRKVDTVIAR